MPHRQETRHVMLRKRTLLRADRDVDAEIFLTRKAPAFHDSTLVSKQQNSLSAHRGKGGKERDRERKVEEEEGAW